MADPLSAKALVLEDALHSRGIYDRDDELVQEARSVDRDMMKGKGKQRAGTESSEDLDENDDDYSSNTLRAASASASAKPRRRSSSTTSLNGRNKQSRSHHYGADDGQLDESLDHHPADRTPLSRIHRKQRHRNRKGSLLSGLLDKDVLPAGATALTKEELRQAYWQRMLVNGLFILAWYCCSTLISFYRMFSEKYYGFGFPLFVTSCHMLVQFVLCSIVLTTFPSLRPSTRPSPYDYGTKALPCGLATGLDIGLSNFSLKVITLTFYTMCKSSVLGFVLLFAFLFKLEKPTLPLIGIIAVITAGVIMMVSGETEYHFWGMIQVLTASALSGLRWSLTQILLDKEQMGMNNPFATLFWLAPIMGTILALCSLLFEGWWTVLTSGFFDGLDRSLLTIGVILLPGCIAFSMNVAEFALIKRTSVVTLSVAGIFKEVATILLSTLIFKDQLTPINVSGLCVALSGIIGYNYMKFSGYRKKEKEILSGKEQPTSNGVASQYPLQRADIEGQFQLVGDEDIESSDESDMGDRKGKYGDHNDNDSIVHLPSYASTHSKAQQREETQQLEQRVEEDPLLVDIERENTQLEQDMQKQLANSEGKKGDLYETLGYAKRD